MCGFSKSTWVIIFAVCAALWMQFIKKGKLCESNTDLTGKTVMITGGNAGIGYETALDMAKRNARVVIACRNEQKAKKAVEDIKISAGTMSVVYLIVDFAEIADIRRAADEFIGKEDRLDILINNAGIIAYGKTKDGFDAMFGVNHLGYFMFTNLLMPLMRKTAKSTPVRIINVSSMAYKFGKIDFDNLNPDVTEFNSTTVVMQHYANSKLMNLYFTSELDARLKREFQGPNQAITTYSLHPGLISTRIGKDHFEKTGFVMGTLQKIVVVLFARPTSYGAQTSICCAVEEGIEMHSGGYFQDLLPVEVDECARDPEIGRKLWTVSEQFTAIQWDN